MKNWQRTQKEVSEFLGAKETGEKGKPTPDAMHPCFIVEIKHKEELPKWIGNVLKQAEKYAEKRRIDKPPLAVIKQKGKHIKNAVVFMYLKDFQDEMGDVKFDGLGTA